MTLKIAQQRPRVLVSTGLSRHKNSFSKTSPTLLCHHLANHTAERGDALTHATWIEGSVLEIADPSTFMACGVS